jgi:hypothetical protein
MNGCLPITLLIQPVLKTPHPNALSLIKRYRYENEQSVPVVVMFDRPGHIFQIDQ